MDKIRIMGIVNLTDDSYYAPSRCLGRDGESDVQEIVRRVELMISQGADIIDLGACSTRPGSRPVGADQEWRRLCPALHALWERFPELVVSIDTYWSSVVARACSLASDMLGDRTAGRLIVNDISAGEDDPQMLPTVGGLGLSYVAMHKRGTPQTMQGMCDYKDVVEDVLQYFRDFALKAERFGVGDWILDPGFGFAKTVDQNYALLRGLGRFAQLGRPVLVGVSRKSMIYKLHGITPEESLPQTQVLHFAALGAGATILRVHDVAEAARTVRTYLTLN